MCYLYIIDYLFSIVYIIYIMQMYFSNIQIIYIYPRPQASYSQLMIGVSNHLRKAYIVFRFLGSMEPFSEGDRIYIYICIPGAPMTSVIEGQHPKTRVMWGLGPAFFIYIYTCRIHAWYVYLHE